MVVPSCLGLLLKVEPVVRVSVSMLRSVWKQSVRGLSNSDRRRNEIKIWVSFGDEPYWRPSVLIPEKSLCTRTRGFVHLTTHHYSFHKPSGSKISCRTFYFHRTLSASSVSEKTTTLWPGTVLSKIISCILINFLLPPEVVSNPVFDAYCPFLTYLTWNGTPETVLMRPMSNDNDFFSSPSTSSLHFRYVSGI